MGDDRPDGARDGHGFLLPVALFVAALIATLALTFIWHRIVEEHFRELA